MTPGVTVRALVAKMSRLLVRCILSSAHMDAVSTSIRSLSAGVERARAPDPIPGAMLRLPTLATVAPVGRSPTKCAKTSGS